MFVSCFSKFWFEMEPKFVQQSFIISRGEGLKAIKQLKISSKIGAVQF